MKLTISFKTNNVVDAAIESELRSLRYEHESDMSPDELEDFLEQKKYEIRDLLEEYIKYGECILVNFDSEDWENNGVLTHTSKW